MNEKKEAAIAAAPICQTLCKCSENQRNAKENAAKMPQLIGEIMGEVASVEKCSRNGEISLMAIIEKHWKGGKE